MAGLGIGIGVGSKQSYINSADILLKIQPSEYLVLFLSTKFKRQIRVMNMADKVAELLLRSDFDAGEHCDGEVNGNEQFELW